MGGSAIFALFLTVGAFAQNPPPLLNVPYGDDPAQVLDLYLPSSQPDGVTKAFVLIHGGAWNAGQRPDMHEFLPRLQQDFPQHAIANMEYRLGNHSSPGYPKQVEDVALALSFLQSTFTQDVTFALMGTSAGAHLSMLYAYSSGDPSVKAVISYVGPADLTAPTYYLNPIYNAIVFNLIGPCGYAECPELWVAASPVTYIKPVSPPTIGFYGNVDILVPNVQMPLLRDALDGAGVINQFTVYNGGHGGWAEEDWTNMMDQIRDFLGRLW